METSKLDPAVYPSLPLDKNWYSVQDLMEEFCVSRATAYRLAQKMPMMKIGRQLRISRVDLERFMRENGGIDPH